MIKLENISIEDINYINGTTDNSHRRRRLKKILGIFGKNILEEELSIFESDEQLCPFCNCVKKIKSFEINESELFNIVYSFNTKTCKGVLKHKCPKNNLNPNSVEYISIENGVSEKEAMKILKGRNSSPFYRENFDNDESYSKYQTRDQDFFGSEEKYQEYIDKVSFGNTREGYIKKYGECGKFIWDEAQIKKDSSSKKFFKSKFGNNWEKEMKRINSYRDSSSLKFFKNKYGDRIGNEKFEINCRLRSYKMSVQYYKDKYGDDLGTEKWNDVKKSYCVTEQKFKAKYGEELGSLKYHDYRLRTLNSGVSKESLKFFIPLYRELRKLGMSRNDIYWGISGSSEYYISTKEYGYKLYDFTIPKFGVIVEYHGSVWHFNKNYIYPKNFTSPFNNFSLKELKEKDDLKRNIAEARGFKVFEIFDTDDKGIFKDNLVEYIKGCINEKNG